MPTHRTVLFICTGNFYRSRFAEAVFNHQVRQRRLPWRAVSRGVAIHLVQGPLSPHTEAAMQARGIARDCTGPDRCTLTRADLAGAARTIALKEAEHRPYITRLFPDWEHQVEYWSFHDLDVLPPEAVLPEIEQRVLQLVAALETDAVLQPR